MRMAKCVRDLKLHLLGNQASVAISLGWEGDLDQVIGLSDRGPLTVAGALGHHLTDENFEHAAPAKKPAAKASPAAAPQSQE